MLGGVMGHLRQARAKTLDASPSAGDFVNRFYSGTTYALWKAAQAPMRELHGLVLDAGSGRGAWKATIEANGGTREALDICPKADEVVTWIADLTAMPQVPTGRYDSVVCHQVLEHVPAPGAALSELHRVLKPGGTLVISVPHLSRQHELPHDYFRFTPQGLRRLLEDAGFEIVSVAPFGGLLTFVHHQLSTLVLGLAATFRPLFHLAALVNAPFSILSTWLDAVLDRSGLLSTGVIAVARKRSHG
jgi:SAM-dependent methyltransferase